MGAPCRALVHPRNHITATTSKALQMLVGKEHLPEPTSPPFMDGITMEINDIGRTTPIGPILDRDNALQLPTFLTVFSTPSWVRRPNFLFIQPAIHLMIYTVYCLKELKLLREKFMNSQLRPKCFTDTESLRKKISTKFDFININLPNLITHIDQLKGTKTTHHPNFTLLTESSSITKAFHIARTYLDWRKKKW